MIHRDDHGNLVARRCGSLFLIGSRLRTSTFIFQGEWVSMGVPSDGSYGIPEGLVFSFPVTIDAATKEWKIVQGLEFGDFAKSKIELTTKVCTFFGHHLGLCVL